MVDAPDRYDLALASDSPDATRAIARALGERCAGGEILLLIGDLGSGKTCFAQGLAAGLGLPAGTQVTSPTFTLHAEYRGRLLLNHLDLYRLDDPRFLDGLGLDEMLADRAAVTAIEWPELLGDGAGRERLEVRLADAGDSRRDIAFAAFGRRHAALLRALAGAAPRASDRRRP